MAEIMAKGMEGKLAGEAFFLLKMKDNLWWAVLDSNQ